jgi:LL-diaminopimelate aminotransferase
VTEALEKASRDMSSQEGYQGYGPAAGLPALRQAISEKLYGGKVEAEEIFISDGAKCDIARLQLLFGQQLKVAVQDPAYPAFVDSCLLTRPGHMIHLPNDPDASCLPLLDHALPFDLLYFCSPNNPTGTVATREELRRLIATLRERGAFLLFDAAYTAYIGEEQIPRSIYEIEGADEVAIEVGSFSKLAGFTGLRLGWTVIPKRLFFSTGESVHADWMRLITTLFNGASCLVQAGGIACLEPEGWQQITPIIAHYLDNTHRLKKALENSGYTCCGGEHAPYVWACCCPKNGEKKSSWEAFDDLLEDKQLITTPGIGFGPAGEGFLRFSGFNSKAAVTEAVARLEKN